MAAEKTPRPEILCLVKKYECLRDRRKFSIQKRLAKVTLGSSVIRALAKTTTEKVRPVLEAIDLGAVAKLNGQEKYHQWFLEQLELIAQAVLKLNTEQTRPRVHPGYKWGHSAKILNSFMQGIVRQSRYFSDSEAKRIEPWLYVPLDSVVMGKLRECNVPTPRRIKEITKDDFNCLQDTLGEAADYVGVSRILFDDVWPPSTRNSGKSRSPAKK